MCAAHKKKRAEVVLGPVNRLMYPEKGGELMEIYTLEVELLEEKIAPLGSRVGSG